MNKRNELELNNPKFARLIRQKSRLERILKTFAKSLSQSRIEDIKAQIKTTDEEIEQMVNEAGNVSAH